VASPERKASPSKDVIGGVVAERAGRKPAEHSTIRNIMVLIALSILALLLGSEKKDMRHEQTLTTLILSVDYPERKEIS
jgi:hypothetical protein